MNHASIFEKKWLDLVFEGRNKAYGAYRLRRDNPITTLKAFFYGFLLLTGAVMALGTFKAPPIIRSEIIDQAITPVAIIDNPFKPDPPKKDILPPAGPVAQPQTNLPPTPASIPEPEQIDPIPGPTASDPGAGTSTTTGPQASFTTGTAPAPEPGPMPTAILDRHPKYPGGIDNFYRYVGNNFKKPDINDVKTMSVIVMFVIEKDGTMTDIKVARDPGFGLGKEAVRVLKALKVKWEPGYKDGEPVRTAYTLPITVNIE